MLLTLVVVAGCSETTASPRAQERETSDPGEDLDPSPELSSYWQSQPELRRFVEVASDLPERLDGSSPAECTTAASELDAHGTPDQLAARALDAPNAAVAEALLEVHAAVSSVMAACRGDAPIGVEEALEELTVSSAALEQILAEVELQ